MIIEVSEMGAIWLGIAILTIASCAGIVFLWLRIKDLESYVETQTLALWRKLEEKESKK